MEEEASPNSGFYQAQRASLAGYQWHKSRPGVWPLPVLGHPNPAVPLDSRLALAWGQCSGYRGTAGLLPEVSLDTVKIRLRHQWFSSFSASLFVF